MSYVNNLAKIDKDSRLYILKHGDSGYTCLGFDVAFDRAMALAEELDKPHLKPRSRGTRITLIRYDNLLAEANRRHKLTGWRSKTELTPQLIGLEGQRVEVVDKYGERRRFWVGKSTGYVPCHLEISRRDSTGGPAVTGAPFKSIQVVGSRR